VLTEQGMAVGVNDYNFAPDEAAHITGQVVSVDGAQSFYRSLMAARIEKKV